MEFYSYLWLREDGTPYYAGKGKGRRAFQTQHRTVHPPKDKTRILVFPCGTEAEAFALEISLIDLYGRKDLGTGILRNMTDGGEGRAGAVASEETRRKQSLAKRGRPSNWAGKTASLETRRKQSEAAKRRDPSTRKSWNTGKHLSEEHKQKQRAGLKKFWATHDRAPISEETRQKLRAAKLGNKNRLGGHKYEFQRNQLG
jgi:hypothetical protein